MYNLISHKFLETFFLRVFFFFFPTCLTYSIVQGSTLQDAAFAAHLASVYIYGHQVKSCTAPYYRNTLQALRSEARDILDGHRLCQFFLSGVA